MCTFFYIEMNTYLSDVTDPYPLTTDVNMFLSLGFQQFFELT
jgi:hypothetical protein